MSSTTGKDDKLALYVGAGVTTAITLLPRIGIFFFAALILGAFAAASVAMRRQKQPLTFNDGAHLGFLSSFYGTLAASAIYDVIWQFFHYELWQIEHLDRLILIAGGKLHDLFSPSAWIVITVQIVVCAIFAGIFGAPSGLLAVKLFERRQPM
jgi:small-conductance mechanosensitive channel